MKLKLINLIFLILPHAAIGQDFSPFQKILDLALSEKQTAQGFESHFNYQKLHDSKDGKNLIDKQSEILAKFDLSQLDSKEKANAFWINSYNFFMIQTILAKGFSGGKLKINSVKELGSLFNPYRVFKEKSYKVGGLTLSLDDMEKATLLGEEFKKKGWKDSRIHFAVNCASVGCPPLRAQVYTPANLDKMLDENIRLSLKTPRHLDFDGKTLHLTHLFKWYRADFEESHKSVLEFIKLYQDKSAHLADLNAQTKIEYIEYDWKLNRAENFK